MDGLPPKAILSTQEKKNKTKVNGGVMGNQIPLLESIL